MSWLHHGRDLWRHSVQGLPVTLHQCIIQFLTLFHELFVGLGHIQLWSWVCKKKTRSGWDQLQGWGFRCVSRELQCKIKFGLGKHFKLMNPKCHLNYWEQLYLRSHISKVWWHPYNFIPLEVEASGSWVLTWYIENVWKKKKPILDLWVLRQGL